MVIFNVGKGERQQLMQRIIILQIDLEQMNPLVDIWTVEQSSDHPTGAGFSFKVTSHWC